ncbi:MAG: complex I subunit 4 family protein [Flammeovirgaceae bacterium]
MLSLIIFTPIFAAFVVLLLPKNGKKLHQWTALSATLLQLAFTIWAFASMQFGAQAPKGIDQLADFQLLEHRDWIDMQLGSLGQLSIDYVVGVDGLNSLMVVLSAIVLVIGAISSFEIKEKTQGYFALYLLLSSTIMGCFLALDFFLFFLFFEFMLLPMYFLIGIWGGVRREYASIKFFLYTLLGSVFILIIMIGLYNSVIDPVATGVHLGLADAPANMTTDLINQVQQQLEAGTLAGHAQVHTFNMVYMMDVNNYIPDSIFALQSGSMLFGQHARLIAFLFLMIGFAIKLPAIPVHTWLPDAHVEAPTAISVILAGLLLKIGAYGILRLAYGIFPEGGIHYAWWVGFFGVLSIVYAAFVALGTHNLKKLIAYSSISHMGFVLLGVASVTSEGFNGAVYQLFSHGIISPMLFLLAGVLYYRTKHLQIETYKGLSQVMPHYSGLVIVGFFASLGLPGFSGFIAELFVFLGAFNSASVNQLIPRWMPIVSTLGLIIGAAYYLWTYQRMFLGKLSVKKEELKGKLFDLTAREWIMILPLAIITLVLGIFPHLLLDPISNSLEYFVELVLNVGKSNLEQIQSILEVKP